MTYTHVRMITINVRLMLYDARDGKYSDKIIIIKEKKPTKRRRRPFWQQTHTHTHIEANDPNDVFRRLPEQRKKKKRWNEWSQFGSLALDWLDSYVTREHIVLVDRIYFPFEWIAQLRFLVSMQWDVDIVATNSFLASLMASNKIDITPIEMPKHGGIEWWSRQEQPEWKQPAQK